MEPLSVIASVTQLLHVSTECARGVYSVICQVHNAPDELQALSNEITDSSVLLLHAKDTFPAFTANSQIYNALQDLVDRSDPVWRELKALVASLRVEEVGGALTIYRYKWVLQRPRAKSLQQKLRYIRTSMHEALSTHSSWQLFRAELLLRSLQSEIIDFRVVAATRADETIKSQTELSGLITQASSQVQHLIESFDNFSAKTFAPLPQNSSVTQHHLPPPSIRVVGSGTSNPDTTTVAGKIPFLQDNNSFSSSVSPIQENSSRIQFQLYRRSHSASACLCRCHKRSYKRYHFHPEALFGHFFTGYCGRSIIHCSCDVASCAHTCGRNLNLFYTFPTWFIRRVLHCCISISVMGEPTIGITLLKRSPVTETSVFAIARWGDHAALTVLLKEQKFRCREVEARSGRCALFWAIQSGSVETVKVLLAFGADAHCVDDAGLSPANYAYYSYLNGHLDRGYMAELENLFPFSHSSGVLDFPHLHNVVCGLRPLDLKTQLEVPRHRLELEARDKKGNTALYWAAARGDEKSVSQLLLAGADANTRSHNRGSPLIASGSAPNPRCIELLLQARADVNATNSDGFSALHAVAQFQTDPAYMRPLIIAGGNINIVTKRNFTPLMVAVFERHPQMCQFLIDQGADLEISSLVGHPPLFEAIRRQSHECLGLLLRTGADTTRIAKDGCSILHHVALYGSIDTIQVLGDFDLYVDHTATDDRGHNARFYAIEREKSIRGFIQAYNALEDAIVSSTVEFVDAVEESSALDHGKLTLITLCTRGGQWFWATCPRIVQIALVLLIICSFTCYPSRANCS